MMGKVIEMVKCPYCNSHVVAEAELVCENCTDKVEIDLAAADMLQCMTRLEEMGQEKILPRKELFIDIYHRLAELLDE